MNLIPFRKYILKSNYPSFVVAEKLSLETDVRKFYRKDNPIKKFEGIVHKDGFNINRILNYRNSFYPIIIGEIIREENNKSTIKIIMRMTIFSNLFMTIWFLITGIFFMLVMNEQFTNDKLKIEPIVLSLFFFLFGYILMIVCFNYEANKSKKMIIELL